MSYFRSKVYLYWFIFTSVIFLVLLRICLLGGSYRGIIIRAGRCSAFLDTCRNLGAVIEMSEEQIGDSGGIRASLFHLQPLCICYTIWPLMGCFLLCRLLGLPGCQVLSDSQAVACAVPLSGNRVPRSPRPPCSPSREVSCPPESLPSLSLGLLLLSPPPPHTCVPAQMPLCSLHEHHHC